MAKIMIIDDRIEERQKAVAAVEAAGHEAVVCRYQDIPEVKEMVEVDGIITDLHFNPFHSSRPDHPQSEGYDDNPPPAGLIVVIAAIHLGKPVVICTDGADGGHHGGKLAWIHDGFVAPSRERAIQEFLKTNPGRYDLAYDYAAVNTPFGWEEDKNWERAVKKLLDRISKA